MALLKFRLGVSAAAVRAAVLSIHVSAAGSGLNQFLVLGLRGAPCAALIPSPRRGRSSSAPSQPPFIILDA